MNYKSIISKAIIITLLATTTFFLIKWQITKYENEKNQEISQIKLDNLQSQLEKSN